MLDIAQEKTNLANIDKEFSLIENRFKEIDLTITKLKKDDTKNKADLENLNQEKEDLTKKINLSK